MARMLVTGAGGFIGGALVKRLKADGHHVTGVDFKRPVFGASEADDFMVCDLRGEVYSRASCNGMDCVYHLAANMGGIGFISGNHAVCARDNVLIDLNMLEGAVAARVSRFFYASSACAYSLLHQQDANVTALREADAWPAQPEEGYGLEKLYAEKLCEYYRQDFGLETRVARFHNVYGPYGTWTGGKEKAPAAICRKVAEARDGDVLEVWGDGKATRSYMYVADCVEGILRITDSVYTQPLNLGRSELISVDELYQMVIKISGKSLQLRHDTSKPQGVRGRNSDNTLIRQTLNWEPAIPLATGMAELYPWIEMQVRQARS